MFSLIPQALLRCNQSIVPLLFYFASKVPKSIISIDKIPHSSIYVLIFLTHNGQKSELHVNARKSGRKCDISGQCGGEVFLRWTWLLWVAV